jgi:hypothetical protein
MKKLILTITAMAAVSVTANGQGQIDFLSDHARGDVVVDPDGHMSTSTAIYSRATSFTAQLWALSAPASSTAGLHIDTYGYENPIWPIADGFSLVPGSTVTNGGNGMGGAGNFEDPMIVSVPGTVSANTVLAVVCWTGGYGSLAGALMGNSDIGILAFVNPVGPAPPNPNAGDISTGWNALPNSPASIANGGNEDFILEGVPEPTTLALAGLGGLALLAFRRRS